jgi:wyosine [tRNA(Phe)-imidazoG37] synthetase (radical SAM superfamily)
MGISCNWLDSVIVYHYDENVGILQFCCSSNFTNPSPFVKIDGNGGAAVSLLLSKRNHIIEQLNTPNGKKTPCHGCPSLKNVGEKPYKIRKFIYNGGGLCNFNCSYCDNAAKSGNNIHLGGAKDYFPAVLSALERQGNLTDDFFINVANGEITVLPNKDEILDCVKNHFAVFYTNAYLYDKRIEKQLSEKKGVLFVSLDSGTRETFSAIKGVGETAFGRVIGNIKKYASAGARIWLKYIFVPGVNDNTRDIDGFAEIASSATAEQIRVSRNYFDGRKDMGAETMNKIIYLIQKARADGIKVIAAKEYFNADENAAMSAAAGGCKPS